MQQENSCYPIHDITNCTRVGPQKTMSKFSWRHHPHHMEANLVISSNGGGIFARNGKGNGNTFFDI